MILWVRDNNHMQKRRLILIGQCVEAFGLIVITGNLTWLDRGYSIFFVGVGCVCMGISQCILTAVIVPEMYEAIGNLPVGSKYNKEAISVYVSNLNMIVTAICEGIGFFTACVFGIGWSYEYAFLGSALLTVCLVATQAMIYWCDCTRKSEPEKKNERD